MRKKLKKNLDLHLKSDSFLRMGWAGMYYEQTDRLLFQPFISNQNLSLSDTECAFLPSLNHTFPIFQLPWSSVITSFKHSLSHTHLDTECFTDLGKINLLVADQF
jgi:hypothetical protein